jgi:hypothetical protein
MVAPGATPATMPVCMIAMPSVSRETGTVRSVSDRVAIIVGAMATPPTSSRTAITGRESTK